MEIKNTEFKIKITEHLKDKTIQSYEFLIDFKNIKIMEITETELTIRTTTNNINQIINDIYYLGILTT